MIRYEALVEETERHGALDSAHRAHDGVLAVLAVLSRSLPTDVRARLAEALPGSLRAAAEPLTGSEARTGTAAVEEIAAILDVTPERGRLVAMAVLQALDDQGDPAGPAVRANLPPETAAVLARAGDAPERSVTTSAERPTVLSAGEVERALRDRPDWREGPDGLRRTVALPEDRIDPLVDRVQTAARGANDHAHVDREPGLVTFVLRTGGGVVTAPDLDLAARIDAIVADFGSGG